MRGINSTARYGIYRAVDGTFSLEAGDLRMAAHQFLDNQASYHIPLDVDHRAKGIQQTIDGQ